MNNKSLQQIEIDIELILMEARNKIGKKQTPSDCPLMKRLDSIPPPTIFDGDGGYYNYQ